MPIYDYKCPLCKNTLEIFQDFDDDSPVCKFCKKNKQEIKMEKQVSKNSTFILKGSGWARDGYTKR